MTGIPSWVQPGASFSRRRYGRTPALRMHVRGVVDDRAVLRHWRSSKQRWEYTVEDDTYFEVFAHEISDIRPAGTGIRENER
jgi:hypothetical protein